jgi:hypothetical protein
VQNSALRDCGINCGKTAVTAVDRKTADTRKTAAHARSPLLAQRIERSHPGRVAGKGGCLDGYGKSSGSSVSSVVSALVFVLPMVVLLFTDVASRDAPSPQLELDLR